MLFAFFKFSQTGKVRYSDFVEITPEQYMKQVKDFRLRNDNFTLMSQVTKKLMEVKAVSTPEERSSLMAILESVYRCLNCCWCKLSLPF